MLEADTWYIMCVSSNFLYVLHNWLSNEVEYATRYAVGDLGPDYTPMTDAEPDYNDWLRIVEDIQIQGADAVSVESILTLLSDINNTLKSIDLDPAGCCPEPGEGQPILDPPLDDLQEGVGSAPVPFGGWELWRTMYCKQAAVLIDDRLRRSLNEIGVYSIAGVGISELALGSILALVSVPFAAIAVILVGVTTIIGAGLWQDFYDDVLALRDEMLCALVEAVTPEQAKTQFDELVDGADLVAGGAQVLKFMVSKNAINNIWNLGYTASELAVTDEDCSQCDPPVLAQFCNVADYTLSTPSQTQSVLVTLNNAVDAGAYWTGTVGGGAWSIDLVLDKFPESVADDQTHEFMYTLFYEIWSEQNGTYNVQWREYGGQTDTIAAHTHNCTGSGNCSEWISSPLAGQYDSITDRLIQADNAEPPRLRFSVEKEDSRVRNLSVEIDEIDQAFCDSYLP